MNMIGYAADMHKLRPEITADRREISVHSWSHIGVQPGLTIFRAENDVKDDVTEGLGHGSMITKFARKCESRFQRW